MFARFKRQPLGDQFKITAWLIAGFTTAPPLAYLIFKMMKLLTQCFDAGIDLGAFCGSFFLLMFAYIYLTCALLPFYMAYRSIRY